MRDSTRERGMELLMLCIEFLMLLYLFPCSILEHAQTSQYYWQQFTSKLYTATTYLLTFCYRKQFLRVLFQSIDVATLLGTVMSKIVIWLKCT